MKKVPVQLDLNGRPARSGWEHALATKTQPPLPRCACGSRGLPFFNRWVKFEKAADQIPMWSILCREHVTPEILLAHKMELERLSKSPVDTKLEELGLVRG